MSDVHHHHYYGEKPPPADPSPKKPSAKRKSSPPAEKPKRKGKPMTRKTQLAINRGRKKAGLKPLKFKKKGR